MSFRKFSLVRDSIQAITSLSINTLKNKKVISFVFEGWNYSLFIANHSHVFSISKFNSEIKSVASAEWTMKNLGVNCILVEGDRGETH